MFRCLHRPAPSGGVFFVVPVFYKEGVAQSAGAVRQIILPHRGGITTIGTELQTTSPGFAGYSFFGKEGDKKCGIILCIRITVRLGIYFRRLSQKRDRLGVMPSIYPLLLRAVYH